MLTLFGVVGTFITAGLVALGEPRLCRRLRRRWRLCQGGVRTAGARVRHAPACRPRPSTGRLNNRRSTCWLVVALAGSRYLLAAAGLDSQLLPDSLGLGGWPGWQPCLEHCRPPRSVLAVLLRLAPLAPHSVLARCPAASNSTLATPPCAPPAPLRAGTVLSSTDSVAALQVLDPDTQPMLFSLVFGEGVTNDATAVVLLRAVQKIE